MNNVSQFAPRKPTKRRAYIRPACIGVTDAAEYLGVSETSIRRRLKSGGLPSMRIGARWLIPVGALDDLIRRGAVIE